MAIESVQPESPTRQGRTQQGKSAQMNGAASSNILRA
jgi:hypothetical protein